MRILLIEDEDGLGAAVRDQIAADGHAVDWARRLDDADDNAQAAAYDLVLLDLMLPDGQGLDFLRRRRAAGDATPVIILTARDQISDRIAGLNAGADDYLVKPFDLSELSARVAAVARRYTGNPNPLLKLGELGHRSCGTHGSPRRQPDRFDPRGNGHSSAHSFGALARFSQRINLAYPVNAHDRYM